MNNSITKLFPKNAQESLQGFYLYDEVCHTCIPIISLVEPLTTQDFRLIVNGVYFTADDFVWGNENMSGGDFVFNNQTHYLDQDEVPNEVFKLLATVTASKFASRHLDYIEPRLNLIENDKAKNTIMELIHIFHDIPDGFEKLNIAMRILDTASNIFEDIDDKFADSFYYASNTLEKILEELADKS